MKSRRSFLYQSGALLIGTGLIPPIDPRSFGQFNTGLDYASPESQGVASDAIIQYLNAVKGSNLEHHAFILMRHGKVISEAYWAPFTPDKIHTLYSLSKSFTSTAIGMAVQEGKFKLTDKVISFFPDHVPTIISDYLAHLYCSSFLK